MTDLDIVAELGLPIFVPRLGDELKLAHLALVIFVTETQLEFSNEHQMQLSKILDFLGLKQQDYRLVFGDEPLEAAIDTLLCFGKTSLSAKKSISTHSISAMLSNPACKREVLHAIQTLKKT